MKVKSWSLILDKVTNLSSKLIVCLSLVILLVSNSQNVHGHQQEPEEGDGSGLFVELRVPWTSLINNENLHYEFILKNASDEDIRIAIPPDSGVDFGWPAGGQPFLEAKYSIPVNLADFCPMDKPLVVERSQWPPLDSYGREMQTWLNLPSEQQIVWNQKHLPDQYFGLRSISILKGLQGHWLVGPGRWISSDVVSLIVTDVLPSERKVVFKAEWVDSQYGNLGRTATAYLIPIEKKFFLFIDNNRVAEVSNSDKFDYKIDSTGTNMEITVHGSNKSRNLYFHIRHGFTRDSPWPIGPVSLFSPKPETIAPAVLRSLRNSNIESPDDGRIYTDIESQADPLLDKTVEDAKDEENTKKWILISISIFTILICIVIFRVYKSTTI